jgi:hypothetical protein
MNFQELRQKARNLVAKVARVLDNGADEHQSLNETWSELEVLYVHARRLLGDGSSLVGTKKDWQSIRKSAQSVEHESDRLGTEA